MSLTTAAPSESRATPPATKRRNAAELIIAYLLILVVIWSPRLWQVRIYVVAALFVVVTTWFGFPGASAMGLRATNFLRSSWIVAVALALAGLTVFVSRQLHMLHPPSGIAPFFQRYEGYILFAFVQQWLLLAYFLQRLLRLLPSRQSAALCAAGMFALAHLPNPILTVATVIWGTTACLLFLHYRNLFSVAIAHAILGITLAICIPGPVTRNMRVGLGYLTYSPHHLTHRSH